VHASVPLLDERGRPRDRLLGGIAWQGQRRVPIDHAFAHHHPDAGVLVRLQARVGKLGAPGIEEADVPVLDQLEEPDQRRPVLLFLRHRRLQGEHVPERAALIVRKDPADAVRVTDVHVAVAKPRRDDHVPGVDDAIRPHGGELRRLAHAADLRALDEDGAVPHDAAPGIDGDEIPRILDFQGGDRHAAGVYTAVLDPMRGGAGGGGAPLLLPVPGAPCSYSMGGSASPVT
jgi:hypothetical protein